MTTISRTALREALKTVGISTKDLTELRIDPTAVTITRLARNSNGETYIDPSRSASALSAPEYIPIGE